MKTPSPPKPPDPVETAAAQTGTNIGTAVAQANLNNVNQVTPYGNLTYDQTGMYEHTDPLSGDIHNIPQFTATQTLSPEQQGLLEQSQEFDKQFNQIGLDQTQKIGNLLSSPVDLSNEATEARLMELGRSRLDPIHSEQRSSMEQQLANQGIGLGTEAYDRAMRNQYQSENDAFNQLLLGGRGQAVQEALTERSAPINEITALLSGGQVQNPSFINTQNVPVAGVDYAGLKNQEYQGQLANWQAGVANQQAMMGGLFGLGSSALGAWAMSDVRVKEDIKKVGKLDDGTNIYKYRYKGQPLVHMGVMAQEVEQTNPDAVAELDSGVKVVNYEAVAEAV